VTRVLTLLAFASALGLGALGVRQGLSLELRQDEPPAHWPRGGGGVRVGGWVDGRGYVGHPQRSEWGAFRGGGPGAGK
jgi:hypothetical protein